MNNDNQTNKGDNMKNIITKKLEQAGKLVAAWKKIVAREQQQSDKIDNIIEAINKLDEKLKEEQAKLQTLRMNETDAFLKAREAIKSAQVESDKLHPQAPSETLNDEFQKLVEQSGVSIDFE